MTTPVNGPPKDIPAAELWVRLTQLPRPTRAVDYPRKDPITGESIGKIVIQVLTQQDQMVAAVAAEKFTREMLKEKSDSLGYDNVYKNASAVEVLYRACKREEDPSMALFPSPKLMRESLTPDEVGVLMSLYLEVQTELGPIVAEMSAEDMEAWVRRLIEGGSMFPLALLSSDAQRELIRLMAFRLYPSLMVTSSAGSPPDESTADDATETPES